MKKNYIFMALITLSSLTFAQSSSKKVIASDLSSVPVAKGISIINNSSTAKAIVDSLHYDGNDFTNA
ncbi:MAG TPA: hypothetical protein PK833_11940, partial [Vicingus sp.]|nr:hypothetical protein [Vicingus sp.]